MTLVIGAGPAGLATAAMLRRHGLPVHLVDRDATIGGAYAKMDPALLMTSPAKLTALPGFAPTITAPYFTAAEYVAYLEAYAATHALVPERAIVESIRVSGPGYRVALRGAAEPLAVESIVVASGVFEHPRLPTFPGTPTVRIIHSAAWRNELARPGMRIVVVGGATSAVEIAELAARAGCQVTIAARKVALETKLFGLDPAFVTLPLLGHLRPRRFCHGTFSAPAGDRGFAALRRRGAIEVRREPVRIEGDVVELAGGHRCEADLVVLGTGYHHAAPFLPADLARTRRGIAQTRRNESVSHRGIFVVGAPCARAAASQYLYGIARDAEAVADTIAARSDGRG
ncbi:MAG: NAD(P)/FAD-dependent oxidoreductase [Deltaproteobacteria bacterium]|nr:NAD(P)/FAD-dependent oxidoreductase [Deltaproteobacteria bacterium]